jgi:hypothetical protein
MRSNEDKDKDKDKALDCFAQGLAHLAAAHGCERAAQIAAQAVLYLHDHPEPLSSSVKAWSSPGSRSCSARSWAASVRVVVRSKRRWAFPS